MKIPTDYNIMSRKQDTTRKHNIIRVLYA